MCVYLSVCVHTRPLVPNIAVFLFSFSQDYMPEMGYKEGELPAPTFGLGGKHSAGVQSDH